MYRRNAWTLELMLIRIFVVVIFVLVIIRAELAAFVDCSASQHSWS